jgi:hypothetical protein
MRFFVETVLVSNEHETYCIDDSSLGCTVIHYVTHISHRMQKHKFDVTSPNTLLWKPHQSHPSMKISALMFRAPEAPECTS